MAGLRRSLRQAKLYGAGVVLLVPAVVRGDTTYEQAWERSSKQIRILHPGGRETGYHDRGRRSVEQVSSHGA